MSLIDIRACVHGTAYRAPIATTTATAGAGATAANGTGTGTATATATTPLPSLTPPLPHTAAAVPFLAAVILPPGHPFALLLFDVPPPAPLFPSE